MKAISIRQPWAWLVIHGGKDIENRSWPTKFRGRVLVHAAKGMTRKEYDVVMDFLLVQALHAAAKSLPKFSELQRGGIIGSVEIIDCVTESNSPWLIGEYGFVLRDPKPMPLTPYMGRLGFFDVSDDVFPSHNA